MKDDNKDLILSDLKNRFEGLSRLEDNWDGYGSKKPNEIPMLKARVIVEDFLDATIDSGQIWKTPHISGDEEGNITIEWYKGKHELHIQVGDAVQEFIKVWGTNVENEMEMATLDKSDYSKLWRWLLRG